MKKKIWRLSVRSEFSAGHALRHYQGKCEHQHGHNFSVELIVEGDRLEEKTEFVIDFKIVKACLNKVLSTLDHCVLNEIQPFDIINPSSENIACYIWKKLEKDMQMHNVKMHSVTVSEKSMQSATYMEIECNS